MDTRLCVRIALHTDRLPRALAGTGVGLGALAAYWQAAHVADATIALDALQTLQIHAEFPAQIAFDDVFAFLNRMDDLRKLRFRQVLGAGRRINVRAFQDLVRVDGTNPVNVPQ